MTVSTLSTYLQVSNNMTKWENLTASEPAVKEATDYYKANIGNVKTPADLVKNYSLFSYAMTAYGLGDMTSYGKGLIEKVLDEGTYGAKDLANTLDNSQILALANTFNFTADGASTTSSTAVQTEVVNKYIEQTLESDQGKSDPGVQEALYFLQNAPNITNAYQVLADKNLLTVVQTALGISPYTSMEDIDTQANTINQKLNLSDFQDPAKLQKFIEKFCAMYDMTNQGATSSQSSTVPDALLSSSSSSGSTGFSYSLLSSMQGVNVGA